MFEYTFNKETISRGLESLKTLKELILKIKDKMQGSYVISFKKERLSSSQKQRNLYWGILQIIEDITGSSRYYLDDYLKEKAFELGYIKPKIFKGKYYIKGEELIFNKGIISIRLMDSKELTNLIKTIKELLEFLVDKDSIQTVIQKVEDRYGVEWKREY